MIAGFGVPVALESATDTREKGDKSGKRGKLF
jgi:hypothetical protein